MRDLLTTTWLTDQATALGAPSTKTGGSQHNAHRHTYCKSLEGRWDLPQQHAASVPTTHPERGQLQVAVVYGIILGAVVDVRHLADVKLLLLLTVE
jgi:hypothetical protein